MVFIKETTYSFSMAVGSSLLYEFSSTLSDQNSSLQSDQEIRRAEVLVLALQNEKSMHILVKINFCKGKLQAY